jgi:putative transposase
MVSPARRRDAVSHLCGRFPVSERRASRLLAQHRSTQPYRSVPADYELRLVRRMNALATRHPATVTGASGRCFGPRVGR